MVFFPHPSLLPEGEGAFKNIEIKTSQRFSMKTRHFSQLPKPYMAYPKVIQGLIFKKPKGEKVLPQVEYVVDSFNVDQKHLKAYNQVCGFKNNGYIPAIYLAVLSQSLQTVSYTHLTLPTSDLV